jgi:hypothetical protein
MPIKIVREGELYAAEVTPPHGTWRSSRPMRSDELGRKLLSLGCDPGEIRRALLAAGVQLFSDAYRKAAEEAWPLLQAALEGKLEIQPQKDTLTEAWFADVLFGKSALSLEDIIAEADAISHSVPTAVETAWAIERLRKRGWLSIEGTRYSLTADGRRMVRNITGGGRDWEALRRLEDWIATNPPTSDG